MNQISDVAICNLNQIVLLKILTYVYIIFCVNKICCTDFKCARQSYICSIDHQLSWYSILQKSSRNIKLIRETGKLFFQRNQIGAKSVSFEKLVCYTSAFGKESKIHQIQQAMVLFLQYKGLSLIIQFHFFSYYSFSIKALQPTNQ